MSVTSVHEDGTAAEIRVTVRGRHAKPVTEKNNKGEKL